MPRFRIHFVDGHTVDKDAPDGTTAKQAAKHERRAATGAVERSDARVKVARVEEVAGKGRKSTDDD